MPEYLARSGDCRPHGQGGLIEHDRSSCLVGELVQRGRETAAGGIAHPAQRGAEADEGGRQLVHGRGIALEVGLELEVAAGDEHGHPVVGERAGDEHAVAREHSPGAELDALGNEADPGRRDVDAVALAALDDLRVARCDHHAGASCGRSHRGGDPPQVRDGEALFDDEAGREGEWPRSRHGEVVDGAVDGELADVSTGEEERLDDVGIGGEREPPAVEVDHRGVAEQIEERIAELLEEEAFDEVACRLSARTVGEVDELVAKLRPPARHAGTCSRSRSTRP